MRQLFLDNARPRRDSHLSAGEGECDKDLREVGLKVGLCAGTKIRLERGRYAERRPRAEPLAIGEGEGGAAEGTIM